MPSIYDIASTIKVWDWRANESFGTQEEIVEWLRAMGPRWAFQLEKTENGYVHWQGRFSTFKKHRGCELAKIIERYGCELPNYLQPACANDRLGEAFYCLKEDSRIEGPWTDKDKAPKFIQNRLKDAVLRPFQKEIVEYHLKPEDRHINLLVCLTGNLGKSYLIAYLASMDKAIQIPMINDYKELMGTVCNILKDSNNRDPQALMIDMPRASSKDRLIGLFSAIETIKDGFSYDTRYHYHEWRFNPPSIWVFSNQKPNVSLLSQDRWRFWKVNESMELVSL